MSNLSDSIEAVEWKVQKLVQKMKLLKEENAKLLEDNIKFTNEIKKFKENKENLEANFSRTKEVLGTSQTSDGTDNKKLKEEIEHYICEIDKCIEWLQSI